MHCSWTQNVAGTAVFAPEPFPALNKNQTDREKSQVDGRQTSDLLKWGAVNRQTPHKNPSLILWGIHE